MPLLTLETTCRLGPADKRAVTDRLTELYADHMETGTGHVAVVIHTHPNGGLALGRLTPDEDAVLLDADVRRGRSFDQQRAFVEAAFEAVATHWGVPTENAYAVVTAHDGEQFHEADRVLASWDADEAGEGP
ncbi:tautomerase [Halosegnis sp.]|uniref:tautomerase n=1 Tax=Halosegnis sp. TaxID=2864959 RepID=UPI0035D515C5